MMLLLGIDIGTSSIKVSVVDAATATCLATTQYPNEETPILSSQLGWAEQSPDTWWQHVQLAILKLHALKKYSPKHIVAIGIAYQMHGLVMVDNNHQSIGNSIIWCDSRAAEIGQDAFEKIGSDKCLQHLLNSPGNFTASKLAWVKKHQPNTYSKVHKIMLPGDYIALQLTGSLTTTSGALSEGIFWDFKNNSISQDVMEFYGFSPTLLPDIKMAYANHGKLSTQVAVALALQPGIPITYKAGDQPNNALSLNVLKPGEVAATAGTSGVIYGISDLLTYDPQSRINSFAHVNHRSHLNPNHGANSIGVLLCINGTGILNKWVKNITGNGYGYIEMNAAANKVAVGSNGLMVFPFGNGAERILNNKTIGASLQNINLNGHHTAHLYRATQEGIACAFRYGLDIMKTNGMHPLVIKAGNANMFLSEVFINCFAGILNTPVELYNTSGSIGAAIGAGLGAGIYTSEAEAFQNFKPEKIVEPTQQANYEAHYQNWLKQLKKQLD